MQPGVVFDLGPGAGELLEIARYLGHEAYGGRYRHTMLRRSTAGLTNSPIGLHADPRIIKHIRSTLENEQALFGGFYTHRWPEESFTELLKVAFRGRVVDRADHPVIARLRGEG